MSRIARYLATTAAVASLTLAAPVRAESDLESVCSGGYWNPLEEDEIDAELSLRLAAFREAVKAAQGLTLVLRPIQVRAIDCVTYGQHIRVGVRLPLAASDDEQLPWSWAPRYTLYVPLSIFEMDPVEQARYARKYVCSIGSGSVTGELTSAEVAACELRAAVAAGDDEYWYRRWLDRRQAPSERGPVEPAKRPEDTDTGNGRDTLVAAASFRSVRDT
jgi:hypothetical protein